MATNPYCSTFSGRRTKKKERKKRSIMRNSIEINEERLIANSNQSRI
jgi:hypothetical protein